MRAPRGLSFTVVALMMVSLVMCVPSALAAGGWNTPVTITATDVADYGPEIAISGSTAVAVWVGTDGLDTRIRSARSTDGGATWSAPVNLSYAYINAYTPKVAISGSTVIATWTLNTPRISVQTARSIDGGEHWGTPVSLSWNGSSANNPQVAISGSTALITWWQSDGQNARVYCTSSTTGGASWSMPIQLSGSGQDAQDQQVAIDGNTILVGWARSNGSRSVVQAVTSADGGEHWGAVVNLSSAFNNAYLPQLALSGSTAAAAWDELSGGKYIVRSATSTNSGVLWNPAVDLSSSTQDSVRPQVAVSGNNVAVTWYQIRTYDVVQVVHSGNGGASWDPVVELSDSTEYGDDPQVALSGGNAVVTWWQSTQGAAPFRVFGVHSTDGGRSWGSANAISDLGDDTDSAAQKVAMSSSVAIVVWKSHNSPRAIRAANLALASDTSTDPTLAHSQFSYRLPDGQECTSLSPQTVLNGAQVQLPPADADCRTPGAVITGWRIPGQSWAFGPLGVVTAVDSQVFTAELREPIVRVVLDSNIAASDACVMSGQSVLGASRETSLYLQRAGMSVPGRPAQPELSNFPAPAAAACAPAGYRLASWNTRGDGSGIAVKVGEPFAAAVADSANVMRMYAMWQRSAQ